MNKRNYFSEVETFFQSLNIQYKIEVNTVSQGLLKINSLHKSFAFVKLHSTEVPKITHILDAIIIHEDVWKNRTIQVKSRLHSLLELNVKIHARQCVAKQIEKKEAEDFLNTHHLHGFRKCATRLGLYKEDELVAVATFSSGRKMNR